MSTTSTRGAAVPPSSTPAGTVPATNRPRLAQRVRTASARPWGEALIALALLTVLAGAVYGRHVLDGGFLMDDWSNAAKTRYLAACCGIGETGHGSGYLVQVRNLFADGPAGYHIGLPVIIPLVFFAFRPMIAPHLALAVGLAVLVSAAMYGVLRHFRIPPVHALAMSALVLLFPWSDANRLWAMAGYNQAAVVLWLAGLALALRAVRRPGLRALPLHAVSLLLYFAGIAIYELVAGPVLAGIVFCWHRDVRGRVPWRRLAVRWAADVAVTAAALLAVLEFALPRSIIPWDQRLAFARVVGDESMTLLGYAAVPFFGVPRWLVAAVVVGVVAASGVAARRLDADAPLRQALRRWLLVAAAGVVVTGAGYAMAIPGGYGRPLSPGIENRVNLVAGGGYVLILYSTAALAGLLVAAALRRSSPSWSTAVPLALPLAVALAVGVGYVRLDSASASHYDASFAQELRVLHAIRDGGPYPPGAHIFPVDYPSFTAVGVPVFAWIWDLAPASKVILDDPSPAGFPVLPGTTFTCQDDAVVPHNPYGLGEPQRTRYGLAFLVDVATGRTQRIDDRAGCEAAIRTFRPGPLAEGRDCALVGGGPATRLDWTCTDGPPPLLRP